MGKTKDEYKKLLGKPFKKQALERQRRI